MVIRSNLTDTSFRNLSIVFLLPRCLLVDQSITQMPFCHTRYHSMTSQNTSSQGAGSSQFGLPAQCTTHCVSGGVDHCPPLLSDKRRVFRRAMHPSLNKHRLQWQRLGHQKFQSLRLPSHGKSWGTFSRSHHESEPSVAPGKGGAKPCF